MILAGLIILAIVSLALSAVSSGLETGVYALNRVRLRVEAERDNRQAQWLLKALEREEDLVITTLTGTNVADYLATAAVSAILLKLQVGAAMTEVYATVILTPLVLVFGGIMPKDLFQRRADQLVPRLAPVLRATRTLLGWLGLLFALRSIASLLLRALKVDRAAERNVLPQVRIKRLLIEGAAEGELSSFQRETMRRVMQMRQVRVREIMTRRERAAIVPDEIPRDDILRIARMAHFSRVPVWKDRPTNVIGILNVLDVLMDEEEQPIRDHLRPAVTIKATETVPAALLQLQRGRQTMGIVVDERGDCIGLFTMKDLVECIVGELEAW